MWHILSEICFVFKQITKATTCSKVLTPSVTSRMRSYVDWCRLRFLELYWTSRQCTSWSFGSASLALCLELTQTPFHKKCSCPLRNSSVSVTKSAVSCVLGHIYRRNTLWKNSFFVQCMPILIYVGKTCLTGEYLCGGRSLD